VPMERCAGSGPG